ncbi:unnamed protein product [Aphanomyces euteiches]
MKDALAPATAAGATTAIVVAATKTCTIKPQYLHLDNRARSNSSTSGQGAYQSPLNDLVSQLIPVVSELCQIHKRLEAHQGEGARTDDSRNSEGLGQHKGCADDTGGSRCCLRELGDQ